MLNMVGEALNLRTNFATDLYMAMVRRVQYWRENRSRAAEISERELAIAEVRKALRCSCRDVCASCKHIINDVVPS